MEATDFLVDSIDDRGLVLGRNGQADIAVGSIFTEIQKIYANEPHEIIYSISLRLIEVYWYRRVIEVVPGGHTAALRLGGKGLNELQDALSKRNKFEYIKLVGSVHGS